MSEFTLTEVAKHHTAEDGWIAVHGKVYDITAFIQAHPGFKDAFGCAISTVIAILRTLGTDCSEEYHEVHSKAAIQQLEGFYIGDLSSEPAAAAHTDSGGAGAQRANDERGRPATSISQ